MLRRIFTSYSYQGVHNPLILPSALKLEVSNRCNLHCKHFLASAGGSNAELALPDLERILAQAKELGVKAIALVGGEPLLRSDLGAIIQLIQNQGMRFSLSTNGMLIDRQAIATIKRDHLIKVSVSLDGDAKFHNTLRGHPRAYERAVAGIQMLSDHKIKTAVAMAITRDNCHLVEHVLRAAIDHGAALFVVNDLIPVGRGAELRNACLSYTEYRQHTERVRAYATAYEDKINVVWKGMRPDGKSDAALGHFIKSLCGAGLTELTIDHEGFVLPCPFLPKTRENVLVKPLKDIWYHSTELQPYQNRHDLKSGCGDCDRKLSCSGCRARALAHQGDSKGPDVRCPRCQPA